MGTRDSSHASTVSLRERLLSMGGLEFLLMSVTPVVVLLAIDSMSFISGWNEGRSGLLFAAFFIVVEWYDARKEVRARWNKDTAVTWILAASLLTLYYYGVFVLNLNQAIAQGGMQLGLPEMPRMFSWVAMWEHVVFALYLVVLFASSYGWKSLLKMITPIAYLLGMSLMFLLDASFPYATLGPMQAIVFAIVPIVVILLGFSGIKAIWQPESSRLFIFVNREGVEWFKGAVDFFWPCVGVHSMIIFFMIIGVMIAKIDAPRLRKTLYSVTGAFGTFFVNVFRIYIICYLIATEGVSKAKAFHESAGEILFMAWAVFYLLAVVKTEDIMYLKTKARDVGAQRTRLAYASHLRQ